MTTLRIMTGLLISITLSSCSRPQGGICSHCPVWWLDPVCLSGGDVPDPLPLKPKALPPPVEADLIPGQEGATYQK